MESLKNEALEKRPVTARLRGSRLLPVAGALVLRVGSAVLQFGLNVLLGRLLGPASLGVYYLFISWLNLNGAVGGVGLHLLTLRSTATLLARGEQRAAQALWRRNLFTVLLCSGALALLIYLLRVPLATLLLQDAALAYVLAFSGGAAVAFAVVTLAAATLKAQKAPNLGLSLEYSLVPAFMLLYFGYVYWVQATTPVETVLLAHLLVLAAVAALASATVEIVFRRMIGDGGETETATARLRLANLREASHFWFINLMTLTTANLPFLMLPHFADETAIGLYGTANRLMALATLTLLALSSIYSPLFAAAYADHDGAELQRLLRQTQLYSVLTYLPLLLLYLVASGWILGLFGEGFLAARPYLFILALGQLINAATGLVTFFNLMTDQERFETRLSLFILLGTAGLMLLGGFAFGALGIAVAMAAALALKNLVSLLRARQTIRTLPAPA